MSDRIKQLEDALRDVRAGIMEHATDTVWVTWIETAVDRIDNVLCESGVEGHAPRGQSDTPLSQGPETEKRNDTQVVRSKGDQEGCAQSPVAGTQALPLAPDCKHYRVRHVPFWVCSDCGAEIRRDPKPPIERERP